MAPALDVVAGFAVGLLVGLTGVGGGALMTPVLVLLFGVAPTAAVGTDLWFAALTKSVGGALHGRKGTVDWEVVRWLWCGSLPASAATLWWLQAQGAGHAVDRLFITAMGGVLIVTAVAMAVRPRLQRWLDQRTVRGEAPPAPSGPIRPAGAVSTVLAGALLGGLVTLTSIGAGALGAVLLLLLHPRRMTPQRLVGTDIVHAVPLTMLAGAGYLSMGAVQFELLGWLLVGSVPGVILGTLVGTRTPEAGLRRLIALVLAVVGARMVMKA